MPPTATQQLGLPTELTIPASIFGSTYPYRFRQEAGDVVLLPLACSFAMGVGWIFLEGGPSKPPLFRAIACGRCGVDFLEGGPSKPPLFGTLACDKCGVDFLEGGPSKPPLFGTLACDRCGVGFLGGWPLQTSPFLYPIIQMRSLDRPSDPARQLLRQRQVGRAIPPLGLGQQECERAQGMPA
jgi:hypothetical protein